MEPTVAYLGLGSNLGDRDAVLAAARDALEGDGVRVLRASRLYDTEPVGGPDGQPWFVNQVLEVETTLGAEALLDRCLEIEAELGRNREGEERWGPRVLDIDLLVFGEARISTPKLTVPHPRIAARDFVLAPLVELRPDLSIPGLGRADVLLHRSGDPHRVTARN